MCHRNTTLCNDTIFPFITVSKYTVGSCRLSCFPTKTNRKSLSQKYPPIRTNHLRLLPVLRIRAGLPSTVNKQSLQSSWFQQYRRPSIHNKWCSVYHRKTIGKHTVFLKPRQRVTLQYSNLKSTVSALKQNS